MEYNILMIEKLKEDIHRRNSILMLVDTIKSLLEKKYNYNVTFKEDLDYIIEEEYANADCVIIHPSKHQVKRLKEFRDKYPSIGLIITPGPRYCKFNGEIFHELIKDKDGVYIVEKPYHLSLLVKAIEKSIEESRGRK